jgi:hypothetical protein
MSRQTQTTKVRLAFIEPMRRAGFVPREPDFLSLLEGELTAYGEIELREAASHITRTRTYSTYPTIGEIIGAIETVSGARARAKPVSPGSDHVLKVALRREACDRIRCTALADPANKEGWLHGLIDFVVEKQRMPDAGEQAFMRNRAANLKADLDALAQIKPQPKVRGWTSLGGAGVTQSLRKLRAAMTVKAEREIFGETAEPEKVAPVADTAYAQAMAAAPDREPLT